MPPWSRTFPSRSPTWARLRRSSGLRRSTELVPGVNVRVRGFSSPVVLRRREGNSAEVEAGPLRMKVNVGEITAIVAQEPPKGCLPPLGARAERARSRASRFSARAGVTLHSAAASEPETSGANEINVIGCTVEEASRSCR